MKGVFSHFIHMVNVGKIYLILFILPQIKLVDTICLLMMQMQVATILMSPHLQKILKKIFHIYLMQYNEIVGKKGSYDSTYSHSNKYWDNDSFLCDAGNEKLRILVKMAMVLFFASLLNQHPKANSFIYIQS